MKRNFCLLTSLIVFLFFIHSVSAYNQNLQVAMHIVACPDQNCNNGTIDPYPLTWPTKTEVTCGLVNGNSTPSVKIQIIRSPVSVPAYSQIEAQIVNNSQYNKYIAGLPAFQQFINTIPEDLPLGQWNYTCLVYSPSSDTTPDAYANLNFFMNEQPAKFSVHTVNGVSTLTPQEAYLSIIAYPSYEESQSKEIYNIVNESTVIGTTAPSYLAGNVQIPPGGNYGVTRTYQKWNLGFLQNASSIISARIRFYNAEQPFLNGSFPNYSFNYLNITPYSISYVNEYGIINDTLSGSWHGYTNGTICGFEAPNSGYIAQPLIDTNQCNTTVTDYTATRAFSQNIENFQTLSDYTLDVTQLAQQALTSDSGTFSIMLTSDNEGANIGNGNAIAQPNGHSVPLTCQLGVNLTCISELEIYYNVGTRPTKITPQLQLTFYNNAGFVVQQGRQTTMQCSMYSGDPNANLVLYRNDTPIAQNPAYLGPVGEIATLPAGNWNYSCSSSSTSIAKPGFISAMVSVGTNTSCTYTGTACINNQIWSCQNGISYLAEDCTAEGKLCNPTIVSVNYQSAVCLSASAGLGTNTTANTTTTNLPGAVVPFNVGLINLMTSTSGFILLAVTFLTAMMYLFLNEEVTLYINAALYMVFGVITLIPSWVGIMGAIFSVSLVILTTEKKKSR